ncbi:hypothetical protein VU07_00275 [Desulfobulbus sp. F4]|nr:hypothetical protein [Desulfobulbus sp. F4]
MAGSNQVQVDKNREFLILQFHALRDEILALKERVIRMQTVAISGIPLIIAAGDKLELDIVIMASPIITVIFVLMLSFEENSIMRAGRYIRKHIEPELKSSDIIGWEGFLQKPGEQNRFAEKIFLSSVIIAFAFYYIGGAVLAYVKVKASKDYGQYATLLGMFYGVLFPFFIFFVIKIFRTDTGNDI